MGFASVWAHDFDRALAESAQAMTVARDAGAQAVIAAGLFSTGFVHTITGRLDEAQEEFTQTLAVSRSAGDVLHEALTLGFQGGFKNWAGEFEAAAAIADTALNKARDSNNLLAVTLGYFWKALPLIGKGDYDDARKTVEEGLALTEKMGDEVIYQRLLNISGWLHGELGDFERAIDLNRRCAEGARKRGDPETVANAELNIADVLMVQGDLVVAGELLEGVHRIVEDKAVSEWQKWRYSMHLFAGLGELWLARGDTAKAREFADRCVEQATRTTSRKYVIRGWRLRGEIALARGQWDEADAALRRALEIAQVVRNPTHLWKTHAAFGRLRDEQGKPDEARGAYAAARQTVDGMRARLTSPELKAALDRAAFVKRLAELSAPG
jgi:tetratricopeptide (TPR) repeat protein